MKMMIVLIASILMTGCSGINTTDQKDAFPTLPDKLELGQHSLSRDTIPTFNYPTMTEDQRKELSLDVPYNSQVIGVRELDGKRTLCAFLEPLSEDPNDFKVHLMTVDKDGHGIHSIDLGRFHTREHQGPMRFGGNRFYTTDASVTFDDASHFTMHRVMTLTNLYLKNHTLTEAWRVEWDNHYMISEDGHFNFMEQKETYRTDGVDDPVIEQYKSRDITNNE